eukprot:scaffold34689_cov57-Phaeocystis_antarctica.AAC.3
MERSIWGPREVSASVPYSSSASVTNSSCCSASPEHHIARRRASTLARLCSRVVCLGAQGATVTVAPRDPSGRSEQAAQALRFSA